MLIFVLMINSALLIDVWFRALFTIRWVSFEFRVCLLIDCLPCFEWVCSSALLVVKLMFVFTGCFWVVLVCLRSWLLCVWMLVV